MNADIVVKSIIFNNKLNKFLLLQRSEKDSVGANTWENAGGNIECGESHEKGNKRGNRHNRYKNRTSCVCNSCKWKYTIFNYRIFL